MNHVVNQLFKIEGKKMKKVLLATTALVMTTGYAAAEVSFSGKASAGVSSTSTTTALQAATTTSGNFTYYDASADAIVEVADGTAAVTLATGDIALGGTNTSIANLSLTGATGTIDLTSAANKIRFAYANTGSLPTASTNSRMLYCSPVAIT